MKKETFLTFLEALKTDTNKELVSVITKGFKTIVEGLHPMGDGEPLTIDGQVSKSRIENKIPHNEINSLTVNKQFETLNDVLMPVLDLFKEKGFQLGVDGQGIGMMTDGMKYGESTKLEFDLVYQNKEVMSNRVNPCKVIIGLYRTEKGMYKFEFCYLT